MPLFAPIQDERSLPIKDVGYEHTTLDAKTSARLGGNALLLRSILRNLQK